MKRRDASNRSKLRGQSLTEALSPPQTPAERHLEAVLQISRAIGSVLDLSDLVAAVMQHVTRTFAAERSSLFLHDAAHGQLRSSVAQGLEGAESELVIDDDFGICGRVFQTLVPKRSSDVLADAEFDRAIAETVGYLPRSMMTVPVAHRPDRCTGVLQVMDARVAHFTAADLELLEAIAVIVSISLDNARLYEAQKRQFDSFVRSFSAALDARDPCTQIHSINVGNYACGIAHELGLDAASQSYLRVAGLLHDVGKIGTPEAILTKPGKLTADEFDEMKRHARHTRHILEQIEFIDELADLPMVAGAHHEKLDGSGYPDGLRGDEIPLRSRILVVADIFDALTQTRHYRAQRSVPEAMAILDSMTPAKLDPDCVAALKRFMGWDAPA